MTKVNGKALKRKFPFRQISFCLRKKYYLVTISSHATWKLISSISTTTFVHRHLCLLYSVWCCLEKVKIVNERSLSWVFCWIRCVSLFMLIKFGCRCMVSSMWEVLKGCLIITYFIRESSVKNSLWRLHLFSYASCEWRKILNGDDGGKMQPWWEMNIIRQVWGFWLESLCMI